MMNNYHANLQMSNDESSPSVKFFRKCAKENQAIFIRGESSFSLKVQQELHADIIANSFLDFFEGSVGIELKVRSAQYAGVPDILIETRSCTNPGWESKGWIYTCEADLLGWVNLQNPATFIRLRVLDMPRLKLFFQRWFSTVDLTKIQPIVLKDKNRTENYRVPWRDIPEKLMLYDGLIDLEGNEIRRLVNRQPVILKCADDNKTKPFKPSLWEAHA